MREDKLATSRIPDKEHTSEQKPTVDDGISPDMLRRILHSDDNVQE
jgi:hypothetical protein